MAMINLSLKLPLIILLSSFIIFTSTTTTTVEASVPLSKTFKYVNKGKLQYSLSDEYDPYYRYRPLPKITNHPFQLCFYSTSTTPDSFTLGLSMGFREDNPYEQIRRWVWAANPNRPVGENSTLIFGRNGNLVLADEKGRATWQTRTTNKGVVDLKLLPNGNLVLVDKDGKFVWQSFRYPTDTLLNGQGIHADGVNKLVSGSYSMVLENSKSIPLYFKNRLIKKPSKYHNINLDSGIFMKSLFMKSVTFFVWTPEIAIDGTDKPNELGLTFVGDESGQKIWAQPKYNSTLSMLQLGRDGNLRVYTYNEMGLNNEWENTYTYFSASYPSTCNLPEKCGVLGLCVNNQCVGCPTSKGLMGWSRDCKPEKIPRCDISSNKTKTSAGLVSYYKMDYGLFPTIQNEDNEYENNVPFDKCMEKCSKDCKCVAFYTQDEFGLCLIVRDQLYTLHDIFDPTFAPLLVDVYPQGYLKYLK